MLGHETRRTVGMMAAGWFAFVACGGSSTDTGTTGAAGTGVSGTGGSGVSATGSSTAGNGVTVTATGSGGNVGSTVATGAGGTGGTAPTGAGGTPELNDAGRISCGTANNGCNPNGNNRVCDLANNRCVQCTSDATCAANPTQMGNPYCDTVGMNGAGLPNDTCEECLMDSHCGTGMSCVNNNCVLTCTSNAQCATASPMNPVCNLAGMPAQCVECLSDTQCAGVMDGNGVPRPHCRLPMTNNANQCRACNTTMDCQAGQTCSNGGNCNNPMDGGGGGVRPEGGRGGPPADASTADGARNGG